MLKRPLRSERVNEIVPPACSCFSIVITAPRSPPPSLFLILPVMVPVEFDPKADEARIRHVTRERGKLRRVFFMSLFSFFLSLTICNCWNYPRRPPGKTYHT